MLDPIVNFFTRIFYWMGRGIGQLVAWLLWPFLAIGRWYGAKGWMIKVVFGALLLGLIGLYGYFFYVTQFWTNFDPDYPKRYTFSTDRSLAGDPIPAGDTQIAQQPAPADGAAGTGTGTGTATADATAPAGDTAQAPAPAQPSGNQCRPSDIVMVSADLVDFNVNQNAWISSMLVNKLGLFGIEWKNTPFMDNKAAFQLGVNQVLRRTTTELVDTLGRVRGTSQIDQNLQDARTALAYPEDSWYISLQGPVRPTPSLHREAVESLRIFNESLSRCQANFDARADNLLQFLDRIASDIGSTSDILRARLEQSNAGWFDPRADDRFWFAYGQLYGYYGVLSATKSDFAAIVGERSLASLWDRMLEQLRSALDMQPGIVSNGDEASAIFPSHLATMGFYLLRVRSNLVEIRSVLDR